MGDRSGAGLLVQAYATPIAQNTVDHRAFGNVIGLMQRDTAVPTKIGAAAARLP